MEEFPLTDLTGHYPNTPDGRQYEALRLKKSVLANDLIRRDRWTMKEARYIDDIIRAGYPQGGREDTGTPEEAWLASIQETAVDIVAYRIDFDAPIDADAKAFLLRSLLSETDAPTSRRRKYVANELIYGGFIKDKEIRHKVESIIATLDDEGKDMVRLLLSRYDERKAAWDRYEKLREGRGDAKAP